MRSSYNKFIGFACAARPSDGRGREISTRPIWRLQLPKTEKLMAHSMSRRALLGAAVAAGLGAVTVRTAAAEDWCWDDPIVEIGGKRVAIRTGVRGSRDEVEKHVDHVRVEIFTPRGVPTCLIAETENYFEERTLFRKAHKEFRQRNDPWRPGDPIPVRVEVTFRATKTFPAAVVVEHRGGTKTVHGRTDREIVVELTLQ